MKNNKEKKIGSRKKRTESLSDGFVFEPAKTVQEVLKMLHLKRSRDVIRKRYGLDGQKQRTLESLGRDYSITRERVRQIEEEALKQLKTRGAVYLKPLAQKISQLIERHGGLTSQKKMLDLFFSSLSNGAERKKREAATVLILELSEPFLEVKSKLFNRSWATKKASKELATKTVEHLRGVLAKIKVPLTTEEITANICKAGVLRGSSQEKRALWSYLDASSRIYPNPFGKWGLKSWPEINPKGARDKAYLVLKEKGSPLHFRELTSLINKTDFGAGRSAYAQTVHNELIKSNKFVLVGRGVYALSEWGYKPGTVRDIIQGVLQSAGGSLEKEGVVDEVLKQRRVKRNTVVLSLNNRQYFTKTKEGRYALAK